MTMFNSPELTYQCNWEKAKPNIFWEQGELLMLKSNARNHAINYHADRTESSVT